VNIDRRRQVGHIDERRHLLGGRNSVVLEGDVDRLQLGFLYVFVLIALRAKIDDRLDAGGAQLSQLL
jgi:hypothetical protein